jgi:hypothetical protein
LVIPQQRHFRINNDDRPQMIECKFTVCEFTDINLLTEFINFGCPSPTFSYFNSSEVRGKANKGHLEQFLSTNFEKNNSPKMMIEFDEGKLYVPEQGNNRIWVDHEDFVGTTTINTTAFKYVFDTDESFKLHVELQNINKEFIHLILTPIKGKTNGDMLAKLIELGAPGRNHFEGLENKTGKVDDAGGFFIGKIQSMLRVKLKLRNHFK